MMSITRGVVRNVVRNVVRGVVRAPDVIQRYFTESSSVTQAHGVFTSTVTATDDIELEIHAILNLDGNQTLWYHDANNYVLLFGAASFDPGRLRVLINGVNNDFSGFAPATPTGKLDTVVITRESGTLEAILNAQSKGTLSPTLADFLISGIGVGSGNSLNAIAANAKIWIDGLRDTGTLVLDSPMDDAPSATEFRNLADPENPINKIDYVEADTQPYTQVDVGWTGPEVVVNGGFDTDTDWAKQAGVTIAGGLLSTDGTTNGELARQSSIGLVAGNVYRVTIVISELTQGSIGVKIGGGASTTYSAAGTYTIDISDGTLDNLQISGTLNAIGSVASISCKRLIEVV
jgi:hypothetical protein